jgi:ligand-binding sensor domain-containing protein
MFRGRDGLLWFWRDSELTSYDGRAWSRPIRLVDTFGKATPGNSWAIRAGLEDRAGRIWLQTGYGLVMSDADHRAWTRRADIDKAVQLPGYDKFHQDRLSRFWFIRSMTAVVYDPSDRKTTRYNSPHEMPGMEDQARSITTVFADNGGRLLFGLDSGLLSLTPGDPKWEFCDLWPFELGDWISTLTEDSSGRIWITASLGVIVLEP